MLKIEKLNFQPISVECLGEEIYYEYIVLRCFVVILKNCENEKRKSR